MGILKRGCTGFQAGYCLRSCRVYEKGGYLAEYAAGHFNPVPVSPSIENIIINCYEEMFKGLA